MTLTPNFLPVGSILNYNTDNGWKPKVLDGYDIGICELYNDRFNDMFQPIQLTPKILTEWCGFEKIIGTEDEFIFKDEESRMILELTEFYKQGGRGVFYSNYPNLDAHTCIAYVEFLHQLQHLYSALTQTVLPITIK